MFLKFENSLTETINLQNLFCSFYFLSVFLCFEFNLFYRQLHAGISATSGLFQSFNTGSSLNITHYMARQVMSV